MIQYSNRRILGRFDKDSKGVFEDLVFENCLFDNCSLSVTNSPELRSTVRSVVLRNCVSGSCVVGPTVFEDVTVDGLQTQDLLILWSPVFNRVTIKGRVGEIKINTRPNSEPLDFASQQRFSEARAAFYANVEWALDISQAEFREFDLDGVPARLVRRDPETQVVVTREKALGADWRQRLSPSNTFWPFVITEMFLKDGQPDIVLVAPKNASKAELRRNVRELEELRAAGVAEPD